MIAATNKNLRSLASQGQFREDLYDRLSAMSIHVPPLRERPEEIPRLSEDFRVEFAAQYGREAPALSAATLERFARYPWPGKPGRPSTDRAALRSLDRGPEPRQWPWPGGRQWTKVHWSAFMSID